MSKYAEYIEKIHSHGIRVQGGFIVGFDEDDVSTFDTIADFAITNHLASVQFAVLTPFPGTRLRERLQQEDRIVATDWADYTGWDATFVLKKMSKDELERGLVQIYQRVTAKDVFLRNMEYFKSVHSKLPDRRCWPDSGPPVVGPG